MIHLFLWFCLLSSYFSFLILPHSTIPIVFSVLSTSLDLFHKDSLKFPVASGWVSEGNWISGRIFGEWRFSFNWDFTKCYIITSCLYLTVSFSTITPVIILSLLVITLISGVLSKIKMVSKTFLKISCLYLYCLVIWFVTSETFAPSHCYSRPYSKYSWI